MGMLSTFSQAVFVKTPMDGKSLKDRLIADEIICPKKDDPDKYVFNSLKIPARGEVDFPAEDGNRLTYFVGGSSVLTERSVFEANREVARKLSRKYSDTVFGYHASYCPGGCGLRTTVYDDWFKDGEKTDDIGIPCMSSAWISGSHIRDAGDGTTMIMDLPYRDGCVSAYINKSDLHKDGRYDYTYYARSHGDPVVLKSRDDGTEEQIKPMLFIRECERQVDYDREQAEREMYGIDDDLDMTV